MCHQLATQDGILNRRTRCEILQGPASSQPGDEVNPDCWYRSHRKVPLDLLKTRPTSPVVCQKYLIKFNMLITKDVTDCQS
jgi:hypothetical protein